VLLISIKSKILTVSQEFTMTNLLWAKTADNIKGNCKFHTICKLIIHIGIKNLVLRMVWESCSGKMVLSMKVNLEKMFSQVMVENYLQMVNTTLALSQMTRLMVRECLRI
jgi:hypothetical protein